MERAIKICRAGLLKKAVSLCYIEETKSVLCDRRVSESDKERAHHCREDMEAVGWSDSDRKWCVQWPPAPYWLSVSGFWPMTDPAFWEGLLILLCVPDTDVALHSKAQFGRCPLPQCYKTISVELQTWRDINKPWHLWACPIIKLNLLEQTKNAEHRLWSVCKTKKCK